MKITDGKSRDRLVQGGETMKLEASSKELDHEFLIGKKNSEEDIIKVDNNTSEYFFDRSIQSQTKKQMAATTRTMDEVSR